MENDGNYHFYVNLNNAYNEFKINIEKYINSLFKNETKIKWSIDSSCQSSCKLAIEQSIADSKIYKSHNIKIVIEDEHNYSAYTTISFRIKDIKQTVDYLSLLLKNTQDFDSNYFTEDQFQRLIGKISTTNEEHPYHYDKLKEEIKKEILNTVFEKITNVKTTNCDPFAALKNIAHKMFDFKFELIDSFKKIKIMIETDSFEKIKNNPEVNKVGLNNVEKYYNHIKNKKAVLIFEYDYSKYQKAVENACKDLQSHIENKNGNKYKIYAEENNSRYIRKQIALKINKFVKNRTSPSLKCTVLNCKNSNCQWQNDLIENKTLRFKTDYKTVVKMTDENEYSSYVPITFEINDIFNIMENLEIISKEDTKFFINSITEKEFNSVMAKEESKWNVTETLEKLREEIANIIFKNIVKRKEEKSEWTRILKNYLFENISVVDYNISDGFFKYIIFKKSSTVIPSEFESLNEKNSEKVDSILVNINNRLEFEEDYHFLYLEWGNEIPCTDVENAKTILKKSNEEQPNNKTKFQIDSNGTASSVKGSIYEYLDKLFENQKIEYKIMDKITNISDTWENDLIQSNEKEFIELKPGIEYKTVIKLTNERSHDYVPIKFEVVEK